MPATWIAWVCTAVAVFCLAGWWRASRRARARTRRTVLARPGARVDRDMPDRWAQLDGGRMRELVRGERPSTPRPPGDTRTRMVRPPAPSHPPPPARAPVASPTPEDWDPAGLLVPFDSEPAPHRHHVEGHGGGFGGGGASGAWEEPGATNCDDSDDTPGTDSGPDVDCGGDDD